MTSPNLHPIVSAKRVARAIGLLRMVPIIFLSLQAQGRAEPTRLALLLLWGFVWPHLAFAMARRSGDGKRSRCSCPLDPPDHPSAGVETSR